MFILVVGLLYYGYSMHYVEAENSHFSKVVKIESGFLSGVTEPDSKATVFKGIPYAAPPVGYLRWRPPQAPAPWKGVRKADEFGPICPQFPPPKGSFYQLEYYPEEEKQSEDCLYLNVWTPAETSDEKRPVMVWIHGGGFVQGQGSLPSFNGSELAKKGIVVVTINYRLGVFGYLAHSELSREADSNTSGNYALLDQICALKWVQNNIEAFGGDPDNVTLAGQSAGSFNIQYLMLSDLAKGLFNKAILESGGMGANYRFPKELSVSEQSGVQYASMHGVKSIEELRRMPAEDLLGNMADYLKMGFAPIVDGKIISNEMIQHFAEGNKDTIPLLIGFNANEATSLVPDHFSLNDFKKEGEYRYGNKANRFFELYPCETDEQSLQAKIDSTTDSYAAAAYYLARLNEKNYKKTYLYCFNRKLPGRNSAYYGAFHSSEIEYIFQTLKSTERPWENVDQELSDVMSSYWVNFVKTGNPNGKKLPFWGHYDKQQELFMALGPHPEMQKMAEDDKLNYFIDVIEEKLDEYK